MSEEPFDVYMARRSIHGLWDVVHGRFGERSGTMSVWLNGLTEEEAKAYADAMNRRHSGDV